MKVKVRHFLRFDDFSGEEIEHLFARAKWIKAKFKSYERYWPLEDRTLAMIFEKQSTRTRLSFEAGMHQLGRAAIFLNTRDSQLGRGEPAEDAAQVIPRMCDIVMIRTFEQEIPERFAGSARVVTTDVWTSMGFESENKARKKDFADWQVDPDMMKAARKDALFMHCLPAHRGEEVAAKVIDGKQSVVWEEAENRLHTQKALMEFLLLGNVKS